MRRVPAAGAAGAYPASQCVLDSDDIPYYSAISRTVYSTASRLEYRRVAQCGGSTLIVVTVAL